MQDFQVDRSKAILMKRGFQFRPFRVPLEGIPLSSLNVPGDTELLVVEREGHRRALLMQEMAYHHVAQGVLGGEPFVVSF